MKKVIGFAAASVLGLSLVGNAIAADEVVKVDEQAAMEVITKTGVVEAVDLEKNTVTIKDSTGEITMLHVGDDPKHLPKVKVGDTVTATYYEGLAVKLNKSKEPFVQKRQKMTEVVAVEGGKPRAIISDSVQVYGKIESIDPKTRKVVVRSPDKLYKLRAGENVDLSKMKVGDNVWGEYLQVFTIAVNPATPAGGKAVVE